MQGPRSSLGCSLRLRLIITATVPKTLHLPGAAGPRQPCALPHAAATAARTGPCLTPVNLLWSLLSFQRTADLTCHVLPLISDLRLTHGSDRSDCHVLTHTFLIRIKLLQCRCCKWQKEAGSCSASLRPPKINNANIRVKIKFHFI